MMGACKKRRLVNLLFWGKNKHKNSSSKECAMKLKVAANELLQDLTFSDVTPTELITLNALVDYVDTFVLKCFKDNKLKHTQWIRARLMESRLILQISRSAYIKRIVKLIRLTEDAITRESLDV